MTPIERATNAVMLEIGVGPGLRDYVRGTAIARAVLNAIREPSEAVLKAMRETVPIDGHDWEYRDDEAVAHWQAMIDAALDEG